MRILLADCCSVSQQLGALKTHTTDTFLFISHTTNVLLFKFRCNIFIAGFGSEWDTLYNTTSIKLNIIIIKQNIGKYVGLRTYQRPG